jgi:CBS-domain-containing membrane protein
MKRVTIADFERLSANMGEKKTPPWSESASELYRPSDRRLSAKLVPTFADRGCHMVSVTNPYGRILGFLDRSRYFSFK